MLVGRYFITHSQLMTTLAIIVAPKARKAGANSSVLWLMEKIHHTTISADYKDYLEPQWRSLCSPKLLEKCLLELHKIETKVSMFCMGARTKTEYCGLDTIQAATGQAVIVFNSGKQALVKLMDQLGIPVGPLCTSYLKAEDYERIKRSESKMEVVTKKRRQTLHLRDKRTEQEHIDEEGTMYLAGNF